MSSDQELREPRAAAFEARAKLLEQSHPELAARLVAQAERIRAAPAAPESLRAVHTE